ncbi:MAG: S8 family serine peptidase [Hyphomonadaceae bacterium]|nr:S8 family serine peptidase [Hyphomonadaceae bacterium]
MRRLFTLALLTLALIAPAAAQLPGLGQVDEVLRDPVESVADSADALTRSATRELRNAREVAARQLLRRNRALIDTDRNGDIVVRSEVVAVMPSEAALQAASAAGFAVSEIVEETALGLRIVVLRAPRGLSTRAAVDALRRLDPDGVYDFNHLYLGAGPISGAGAKQAHNRGVPGDGSRVGLIDSGVESSHAAFAGIAIVQRGFAGEARAGPHGTAVASLLADRASLYVADVYGDRPTGGGASAIVAAMGWLAQSNVGVINISLVGPPNRALEAAVRAAIARGHVIVAAVGNGGPAAAPLYPASYPGVVGVTGVDARERVLPEAGRGPQVDFAALGAGVEVAAQSGGTTRVRGTSYAAPIVSRLFARDLGAPDPTLATQAQQALTARARDLGARGRDDIFGVGFVSAP